MRCAPVRGLPPGLGFLALTDPADRARFWPFVPTRVEQTCRERYAEPDRPRQDQSEARRRAAGTKTAISVPRATMARIAVQSGGLCRSSRQPKSPDGELGHALGLMPRSGQRP